MRPARGLDKRLRICYNGYDRCVERRDAPLRYVRGAFVLSEHGVVSTVTNGRVVEVEL